MLLIRDALHTWYQNTEIKYLDVPTTVQSGAQDLEDIGALSVVVSANSATALSFTMSFNVFHPNLTPTEGIRENKNR